MKKLIISAFVAFAGLTAANAQTPAVPAPENKNQAEITFDKEVHDFGVIPQNIPATYTFYFKNTGKEPLIITQAAASCGCTTPEWTKDPIKPGQKGFIKATYNATNVGAFNKSVTVMSNAKRSTVALAIKGEVKVPTEAPVQSVTPDKK
jgi:archaellum component FlaG (FlaF/FlaG flagellin family)